MSKKKDLAPARGKTRPYSRKERKKRFLLCCEGKETEPRYFDGLARFLRSKLIEVVIAEHEGTDPKRIVELAKEQRKVAEDAAKRSGDDNLRYDEVWCVFDRDEHVNFDNAIQQARANHLGLAVSNPSFELWILIHFQDQYAALTRKEALRLVRKHIPEYDKKIDFSQVKGRADNAISRAEKMELRATEAGNWIDNPTSSVWRLVVLICRESNISTAQV